MNSKDYVDVFTDGACPGNGLDGAKAGIVVFFGDNSKLNVSAPVVGPADSNIAEIQAVTRAAEVARSAGITKLRIHTADSQVVMESAAELTSNGKLDGSTAEAGKPAATRDALQKMAAAVAPLNVQWNHVRGHDGIHGNDMADKLARKGADDYTPR